MTTRDDFDRHLAAWFEASAPSSEPEPLLGPWVVSPANDASTAPGYDPASSPARLTKYAAPRCVALPLPADE